MGPADRLVAHMIRIGKAKGAHFRQYQPILFHILRRPIDNTPEQLPLRGPGPDCGGTNHQRAHCLNPVPEIGKSRAATYGPSAALRQLMHPPWQFSLHCGKIWKPHGTRKSYAWCRAFLCRHMANKAYAQHAPAKPLCRGQDHPCDPACPSASCLAALESVAPGPSRKARTCAASRRDRARSHAAIAVCM
jgi:hypothetical protein